MLNNYEMKAKLMRFKESGDHFLLDELLEDLSVKISNEVNKSKGTMSAAKAAAAIAKGDAYYEGHCAKVADKLVVHCMIMGVMLRGFEIPTSEPENKTAPGC